MDLSPNPLAEAVLLGEPLAFDMHSGQPLSSSDANFSARRGALLAPSRGAQAGLEPPRYCGLCGRRMKVQVSPMGWSAECSRHGELTADDVYSAAQRQKERQLLATPDPASEPEPQKRSESTNQARQTANPQPPKSIFAIIGELAAEHNAINLGQGAPDEDGPLEMRRIAAENIAGEDTCNQYGPARGMSILREAIAADRRRRYGHELDPATDIAITVGATEALAAAILAFASQDSEVIVLEPAYDSYPAAVALAGAKMRAVPLRKVASNQKADSQAPTSVEQQTWQLDRKAVAEAVNERTRMLILNTPHNPTGYVASREDLEFIAQLARTHDLIVLTDEVYERLVFPVPGEEGARSPAHIPLATLPGMRERTVSVASAGKLFNVTGWKVGWAMGPAHLIAQLEAVKQYLTFTGATPFQPAVAWTLNNADDWSDQWCSDLRQRRDELAANLREVGMDVIQSEGTYFLVSDLAPLVQAGQTGKYTTAEDWCRALPELAGVAAIPVSSFTHTDAGRRETETLVRWTFCKSPETLQQAMQRLRQWQRSAGETTP
ncbi:aminotransferase class I/II-fold pyridoxal phosphate-dependent enzyme [Corynebacterium resistens]|uniref:biotin synthase auxiliary protein BsaP n=1 Tax=Corynebacterium resistens TaxID=258224 RepID=UPI0030B84172